MTNEIQPLQSDISRQATNIIKAYVYQAWESLYTWINLDDDEVLFLEGTEDFDLLSGTTSTTTQVKHLSKNLTLRSEEVAKAISDFWLLRQREKRQVIFQFFTTAARGQEKGNPFNGSKGLDYWEKCKSHDQVKPLRQFLLQISGFPKELLDYIKTSSDEDLLNTLIIPLHWLTEKEDLESLRKKVEDVLVLYGDKHGVKADDSKKAALALIDIILDKLCKKDITDRCLGKADFIREFEASTMTMVSKSELQLLRDVSSRMIEDLPAQIGFMPSNPGGNTISTQISKPHLVDKKLFIVREKLKQEIVSRLKTNSFLVITGSSGMGKSTLSLQVVEDERDEWERVSFRGLEADHIRAVLNGLCNIDVHEPKNIVLDDINFGQDHDKYVDAFEAFIHLLRSNNKKVLVTSQKGIPPKLSLKLSLTASNVVQVPIFSAEEIKALLLLNSCPTPDLNLWMKDIKITTKSHPQLVHARIRRLKEDGWNKSKVIFKTEELTEVKREVVSDLISELPSPESRDLLLRLSILSGPFKQKNAIALASYPKVISTPSVFFNQLVGPYVEQISDDYYSLSPLLDGAFQGNFTEKEVKVLHALAGESYLSKTLTPRDLSNIFLHGIVSGSGRILYFAFAAFQSIDNKHKALIYPYLEWLTAVHIGTNKLAIPHDEISNLMFRFIQFTIAVDTKDPRSALAIADVWFNEIKRFTAKGPFQKQKEAKLFPFMFFLSVFRYESLPIPISKCIEWIIAAYDFIDKNPEINTAFRQPENYEKISWREMIPQVALTKRVNSSNIEEFMSSMASLPQSQNIIDAINNDPMLSRRVVDNIWLDQVDKEKPDWQEALEVLNKLRSFSAKKKASNISALAVRAMAIIKNEYTQDKKGAESVISTGVKELGSHPEILNYKAKMAFIDRDYKVALKRWSRVLPKLSKDLTAAFAYRDAAVSAANLNDWKTASQYFKQASLFAKNQNEKLYETQCLADYGFALWKLGKYEQCIDTFIQVIETLPKLPDPKTNLRSLGLLKMTANTLIYFRKTTNPEYRNIGIDYTEPFAGAHSQTDFSEKLRDLPITPPVSLLGFLAEVEVGLNAPNNAFNKLVKVYDKLPILFQAEAKKVQVVKSLRDGDLKKVVDLIVDFFTLTHISVSIENRHIATRKINTQDIEETIEKHGSIIVNTLSLALLCFTPAHPYGQVPWKVWKQSGYKLGLEKNEDWANFIQEAPTMTKEKARQFIGDSNSIVALRVAASVYILKHDGDRNYSLYASALLTSYLKDFSIFCWVLDDYLVELLIKRWTEIADFLFSMWHDEGSKGVLSACKDRSINGIKKAAKIVLSASEITSLSIDNVREKLVIIGNG